MTILQALKGYYDRVAEHEPETIAPDGYSDEKISFAIVIGGDGQYLDVDDLRDHGGKKPQPTLISVPASFKRPGVTPRSFFLWDKTAFALGVTRGERPEQPFVHSPAQHKAFRQLHLNNLEGIEDAGLLALRRFIGNWSPDQFMQFRYAREMPDTNIVFRLDGERGFIHDRATAQEIWSRVRAEISSETGMCLVTGEIAPIARIHPAIKGLPGQTTGGSIVSFNKSAFTSYGMEQGENAPVSEKAAFAYTTALNRLLRVGSRNRVAIADATTVFWAEAASAETAEVAEVLFTFFIEPPSDKTETTKLGLILDQIKQGRPLADIDPKLDASAFYILGLVAPDPARLSIRFWHRATLGELGQRFHEHWQDLEIAPRRWTQLPAIRRLLFETAAQRKKEDIPNNLAGEIMRSILAGRDYPATLLSRIIGRIRSDHDVNELRAALVKACIVRPLRRNTKLPKENYLVSLDRENADRGYRLGRLFAVLEAAQRAGVGKVNATIRDKYIGAASASPHRVFPLLLKGVQDHLSAARKKGLAGRAIRLEKEIGEIVDGLDARQPFPATLQLIDQGHFFVGFYHQRADLFIPRQPNETAGDEINGDEPGTNNAIEE